jgi:hypothetical protein
LRACPNPGQPAVGRFIRDYTVELRRIYAHKNPLAFVCYIIRTVFNWTSNIALGFHKIKPQSGRKYTIF